MWPVTNWQLNTDKLYDNSQDNKTLYQLRLNVFSKWKKVKRFIQWWITEWLAVNL